MLEAILGWVCVCVGEFDRGIGKFDRGMGKFDRGIGKFDRGIGKFGKSKNFFEGVGKAQRTLNNIKDMPSALIASLP